MTLKVLVATMIVAASAGIASAADLPMRSAPPVFAPPMPVFTWTGFYLGVNAGYVFDGDSRFRTFDDPAGGNANGVSSPAGPVRPGSATVSSNGFTGGGQIGYNYQFGVGNGVVVGVEADAAYTDLDRTKSYVLTNPNVSRLSVLHADMDFLGTVRGRIGYAFDQFLIYGTGGFAYGDVSTSTRFYEGTVPTSTLSYFGRTSGMRTGYAYGGGIEYALPTTSFLNFFHASAVTLKAEYLHYDLGTKGIVVAVQTGGNSNYTQRIKTDGDLARVGINYKF